MDKVAEMPGIEQQPTGQTERGRHPQESYLESRLNLYRIEKRRDKREALIPEIVDEATKRRDDLLAVFQTINTLSSVSSPESNEGLVGLYNYFRDTDFVIKRLTPGLNSEDQEKLQLRETISDIKPNLYRSIRSGKFDVYSAHYFQIAADQCENISSTISTEEGAVHSIYPIFFSTDQDTLNAWEASLMGEAYVRVIMQSGIDISTMNNREILTRKSYLPYQTIKNLETVSTASQLINNPINFDLYRRPFGGISLKDVMSPTIPPEQSNRQIDRFLSALPQGDYLWNFIIGLTFAIPTLAFSELRPKKGTEVNFEDFLNVLRKVTNWQYHLAEQVLLPPLSNAYNYPLPLEFEPSDYRAMLAHVVDGFITDTGQMLFLTYAYGSQTKYSLNKKENYRKYRAEMPFSHMADTFIEYQNEEEAAMLLMNQVWDKVKPQLRDSFSQVSHRPAEILGRFARYLDIARYKDNLKNYFTEWVDKYFGSSFLNVFKEAEPQMVEVINRILRGTYELPGSRWGETISDIEVSMGKDSLLKKLGVVGSSWKFPDDLYDNIPFILEIINSDANVSGYVNLDTQSIEFRYLELPPELRMMDTMLKLTVASTLHDIVGRKVKKWRHGEGQKLPPKGQSPKPRGIRKLPRYWYQVDSDQLIEDFYHPKPAQPHGHGQRDSIYINARTRRVPYGAKAESFIEKIYSSETPEVLKIQYLQDFRNLRDGKDPLGRVLAQANPEKLKNFPEILKEELNPVIDPDGHLLYTRTWVEGHFNPSLPAGSYDSYIMLHDAVYRAHGSSLAFLDAALAHIAGFETE